MRQLLSISGRTGKQQPPGRAPAREAMRGGTLCQPREVSRRSRRAPRRTVLAGVPPARRSPRRRCGVPAARLCWSRGQAPGPPCLPKPARPRPSAREGGNEMSEAASVPFSETKAPESAERLHRGALGLVDISASTMANIGPAYSFYFGFALIALAAGIASPLVIVVAIVAIALLGNTLAQFSRAHPSTGGFITFVGKTFGGTSAVTTALLCGAGYIIAISSVLVISGGFLSLMIAYYTGTNIPWIIFSAIFTAAAMFMMFRGVAVSTKLAGFFFGFELLVLLVVSIAALIKNGGHLSGVPFEPSHITNHFSGLALAFPLGVYLFIGWENSAALAEETNNPRRNVPRAVFLSIALMAFTYLLVAYAITTGFHYSAA